MFGHLIEWWASVYANHAALRTAVEFVHVGGLLAGGGCAIAADRSTLLTAWQDELTRATQLRSLRQTHRIVLVGIALMAVSGVLLVGADAGTFLASRMFWLKMGLLGLLMANGALIVRIERRAEVGDDAAWRHLRFTSTASLALWFLTTLAGAALPNLG